MSGEKNLNALLKSMQPVLNPGEYVFCTIKELDKVSLSECIMLFKEPEGMSIILNKEIADVHKIEYSYVANWITLTVHSSLEAVGLTAAFSQALANENISCNVVAGYYHDHIFTSNTDSEKAMEILQQLAS
jgi:hypothetical protein